MAIKVPDGVYNDKLLKIMMSLHQYVMVFFFGSGWGYSTVTRTWPATRYFFDTRPNSVLKIVGYRVTQNMGYYPILLVNPRFWVLYDISQTWYYMILHNISQTLLGFPGITPGKSWLVVSGYFKKYPQYFFGKHLNIWLPSSKKRDNIIYTQKYPGIPENIWE